MPAHPAVECLRNALTLMLKEVKAAIRAEAQVGSRQEEAFENGKLQALAFGLQVLVKEVEQAQLSRESGACYTQAKKLIEEQGFGDFDLEDDSDI